VTGYLDHVFASERLWLNEGCDECLIQNVAMLRADNATQRHTPRLERPWAY
jgi:hypothetical protein